MTSISISFFIVAHIICSVINVLLYLTLLFCFTIETAVVYLVNKVKEALVDDIVHGVGLSVEILHNAIGHCLAFCSPHCRFNFT